MATNPIQDILQMLMQQGGVGNMPAMQPGVQQAGGMNVSPAPAPTGEFMPPQMPMPPQQMASLQPSGGMPDQATPAQISESENMESYGDQRFGPMDDKLRQETEDEIEETGDQIRAGGEGMDTAEEDYEWQGERVPTPMDLQHMREHPTDGTLMEFFQRFPDYMRELLITEGHNPGASPDQYAMPDEEWEELQADRSTRIDER